MPNDRQSTIDKPLALDFFAAGVPAGAIFEMLLRDLEQLLLTHTRRNEVDRISELCFIGVVSYFEAFCKDHAASVINIAPDLIENLRQGGHDTRLDAQRSLEFGSNYQIKVGCLLMESYDFGTAKSINAIYNTLLKITPFSKNEKKRHDDILRDRNLLIHHGGIYTSKYLQQTGDWRPRIADAYLGSLTMAPDTVGKVLTFYEHIAEKITRTSHAALSAYFKAARVSLEPEREKALNFLLWPDSSS